MDLSIIIVNWNSVDYLRTCIGSIYENTKGIEFEIIVVDNASPNGDVGTLREPFPEVRIIQSEQNLGFARANNLGFRHSRGSKILILNPDTQLVGPAINRLLDAMAEFPGAGILGARHVNPDLTVQTTSIHRFPTILRELLNIEALRRRWPSCPLWRIQPLFSEDRRPTQVEIIPGACMLLRREVFEEAGMFGEEYFMYAEDIDLNYKVEALGYQNYYIPDAVIVHFGGGSSSRQKINQWATRMQQCAMSQYYEKTRGRWYVACYKTAMGSCALARLCLVALAKPFGNLVWNRQSRSAAAAKWGAILQWAVGIDGIDKAAINGAQGR